MHGYASVPVLRCVLNFWNRRMHYDVIASRDCRTAARQALHNCPTFKRKGTRHRCSTAMRPSTRHWSPPPRPVAPSTGCGRPPGSCYTCSWSPLLMKSACYLPVSRELCRYPSLPFAVCKCIQPVSAKLAGLEAAAARAPVLEKCNRSPVLKADTG